MDSSISAGSPRSCYECGYFATTPSTECPQCNRTLHTFTATRVRGGLLAAIGLCLAGFMTYLLIWAFAAFRSMDPSGAKFTGDKQQKLIIVGLFLTLIVFGLISLANGVWQLIFGRRSKAFTRSTIVVALLIAVGCGMVISSF